MRFCGLFALSLLHASTTGKIRARTFVNRRTGDNCLSDAGEGVVGAGKIGTGGRS